MEGGFHEGLATSAYFRRETISIGACHATHNTQHENEVVSSSEIVTKSGADRLIGGGAVGFFVPSSLRAWSAKRRSGAPAQRV